MRAPSAAQLIGMWERGARQPWVDRALTLVSACHPELTDSGLAALTVGERDADLLALREGLFGRALKSFAECPNCRARLEFSVDVNELRDGFAANGDPAELTVDDIRIQFRRLNTADLTAAARCADVNAARGVLLQRCVVEARRGGAPLAAADLPAACVEALSSRLAALDGAADISLDLRCVACAHVWQLTLDIV
ncbi:MAG: phage baseplate protein, partial [Candidatus Binatia bacterium]